jgi:uncharacterized membrane protein
MYFIIFGFIIFLGVHLVSLSKLRKDKLLERIGEKKYKLIYSLLAFIGLSLMLFARFNSGEVHKTINFFFFKNIQTIMLIANILIISAYIPRNHFKKWFKHPMLLGILIWSFSHLMINQHLNHTVFFTSLFLFSLIMIFGILKRDGLIKTQAKVKNSIICLCAGIVVHGILLYSHAYIAGVNII